ncbi:MAG: hypothetical protein IJZ68_06480 [Bacteroidaceae bacterium]|nr:hypothetical protein [Bacteroidaceae bacterium]
MTLHEQLANSKQTIKPQRRDVSEQVGYQFTAAMAKDTSLPFDVKLYAGRIQGLYENYMARPENTQWWHEKQDKVPTGAMYAHVLRDVVIEANQVFDLDLQCQRGLQEYTEKFIQQLCTSESKLNESIMTSFVRLPYAPDAWLVYQDVDGMHAYTQESFCERTGGTPEQYKELSRLSWLVHDWFANADSLMYNIEDTQEIQSFLDKFDLMMSDKYKVVDPNIDPTYLACQCAVQALQEATNHVADTYAPEYALASHIYDYTYRIIAQHDTLNFDGITIVAAGEASLEYFLGTDPEEYLQAADDDIALDRMYKERAWNGDRSKYSDTDVKWGFVELTPYQQDALQCAEELLRFRSTHMDDVAEVAKALHTAIQESPYSSETALRKVCEKLLSEEERQSSVYQSVMTAAKAHDLQQTQLYAAAGITPSMLATKTLAHFEEIVSDVCGTDVWAQFYEVYAQSWESSEKTGTIADVVHCATEAMSVLDNHPAWAEMLQHESNPYFKSTEGWFETATKYMFQQMIHLGGKTVDENMSYHMAYAENILEAMKFQDRARFIELYTEASYRDPNSMASPLQFAYTKWQKESGYDVGPAFKEDIQRAYIDDADREECGYHDDSWY